MVVTVFIFQSFISIELKTFADIYGFNRSVMVAISSLSYFCPYAVEIKVANCFSKILRLTSKEIHDFDDTSQSKK